MTIASRFRDWIEANRDRLAASDVTIVDKGPSKEDNKQDKASVGLSKNHILVSFTVWERTPVETSLIVYNRRIDKTVKMDDEAKSSLDEAISALSRVADSLISGLYDNIPPDAHLTVT